MINGIFDLLEYNPDTGDFLWKVDRSNKCKKGSIAGGISNGYRIIQIDNHNLRAHRLAFVFMGVAVPEEVDHIDTNRSNNKWSNLRPANRSTQIMNSPKRSDNTSGYKGVSWNKEKQKFEAKLKIDGVQRHLGYHSTAQKAHESYCAHGKEIFGEYFNDGSKPVELAIKIKEA